MANIIDDVYITVSRITTLLKDEKDEKILGYGTGFFFSNKNKNLFLITNRHVIRDEKKNHFPNFIRLQLHTNPNDLKQNGTIDFQLYEGIKQLWVEINPSVDVVAIPLQLNELQQLGFSIKAFNSKNFLPSNIKLRVGEDVLIIGYPLGIFYDDVNNLPTVRNGIIASAYPAHYRENPYFLVDARLHEGTSGSPVITKQQSSWQGTDGDTLLTVHQFFLLGINSATWPVPENSEPLGLNIVYFSSIIEQLTN